MAPRNILVGGVLMRAGFRLIQHPAEVLVIASSYQGGTCVSTKAISSKASAEGTSILSVFQWSDWQWVSSNYLMDGIRASVFSNTHPHFVYILHQQMPKPSCLEFDWSLGLLGMPHILKGGGEQAVMVQARAPSWRGRVHEGRWWCCRGWAQFGPVVAPRQGVILVLLHGHAGQREVGAARGAGRLVLGTPKVELPASLERCHRRMR